MPKWRQWETSSEADWTLALERECVVRPLAESGKPTKEGLRLAMVQLGLGRSVLYKLLRRYRQRPQTSSLLPWKRGRGSEVRCLTHEREELLQSCIREFYLKPERPSVAALAQEVKRRFSQQGFPSPHYRTIGRRIEALDLRFVMRKREGAKRAREKFGPVGVSTLGADSPMDVLQIDHTLVDVIVVSHCRHVGIQIADELRKHLIRDMSATVRDLRAARQKPTSHRK